MVFNPGSIDILAQIEMCHQTYHALLSHIVDVIATSVRGQLFDICTASCHILHCRNVCCICTVVQCTHMGQVTVVQCTLVQPLVILHPTLQCAV